MMATDRQKREAWDAVASTLGLFTLTTSPYDPAVRFGFECALNAIVERDRQRMTAPFRSFAESVAAWSAALRRANDAVAAEVSKCPGG